MDGDEVVTVLTPTFHRLFPSFLVMGMTYDQYWLDDVTLTKAYRKAYEIRRDEENTKLWLQGLYFYSAILSASPVFHAFAKKGTKPNEYLSEPFPLTEAQRVEQTHRENERNLKRAFKLFKVLSEVVEPEEIDGAEHGTSANRDSSG